MKKLGAAEPSSEMRIPNITIEGRKATSRGVLQKKTQFVTARRGVGHRTRSRPFMRIYRDNGEIPPPSFYLA